MALERIEKLLHKYFEGKTTIAEENELSDFFSSADVPAHLSGYQELFGYFVHEKRRTLPLAFEKNLMDEIERSRRKKSGGIVRRIIYTVTAVAAAVVLVVILITGQQSSERVIVYDEPGEKQLAYSQTKNTLKFVSSKLNIGLKNMEKVGKFNEAKNKISKQ